MLDGVRSEDLALSLGAVQEARRLGSRVVGTEHLLIATLTDPLVRRTFLSLGIELRHLQTVVSAASAGRPGGGTRGAPELTAQAAEAIERLGEKAPEFCSAPRAAPGLLSAALRALLTVLMAGLPDTSARRVLDGLMTESTRRVLITQVEGDVPPPLLW